MSHHPPKFACHGHCGYGDVLNLTRDFIKPYDERVIRIHSVQAKPGISGIFRKSNGKPGNHREI